ncbi:MAG: single-stranded DNA-binding protein [Erysipelotrichaceae bacterium]|nr:single-stranded DNA-binding protein [Erysipelotrichaceae bacterium]MDY3934862.1 single-stranded DNA-binding protein [Bacilli bacterium]
MNKVFLIGRLSRDPELRHTTSGMPVCQINVAISRPVGQGKEPETDFINVVVWNKQAENVSKYLAKGRQIAIEGRIQTRNYDNNEGKRVYVTEVIASNVEFLGSANDQTRNTQQFNDNPFDTDVSSQETANLDNDPFASFGEKVEISDNDLPF